MNRFCIHFILLPLVLLLSSCGKPTPKVDHGVLPGRIISMAPNITETLYALGLEDKLVGATTYCRYPAAANDIPRIGGFGQFNYEAILRLNPDLVILHKEYDADKTRLDGLDIPYLETGSYFVADILNTIEVIGDACGAEQEAIDLVLQLETRINALRQEQADTPRVLITFGGSAGDDIEQLHAFGTECIHNELLEMAGGRNIVAGKLPYSILSKEAILRLNPDIIIELAPERETPDDPAAPWQKLSAVNAVKNSRIYCLTGDYTCIPGPRFIQTLEDFVGIIRGPQ